MKPIDTITRESEGRFSLRPWHEVVGTVKSVEITPELAVINLSFERKVKFVIPRKDLRDCPNELEELIGKKISILRTRSEYILNSQTVGENSDAIKLKERF